MRTVKNCPYCKVDFLIKRIDQIFCKPKCRIDFNNNVYKSKIKTYKNIADNLRTQDILLEYLLEQAPVVYIKLLDFPELGININHASQVIYRNDRLIQIVFGKYQLLPINQEQYKISKV